MRFTWIFSLFFLIIVFVMIFSLSVFFWKSFQNYVLQNQLDTVFVQQERLQSQLFEQLKKVILAKEWLQDPKGVPDSFIEVALELLEIPCYSLQKGRQRLQKCVWSNFTSTASLSPLEWIPDKGLRWFFRVGPQKEMWLITPWHVEALNEPFWGWALWLPDQNQWLSSRAIPDDVYRWILKVPPGDHLAVYQAKAIPWTTAVYRKIPNFEAAFLVWYRGVSAYQVLRYLIIRVLSVGFFILGMGILFLTVFRRFIDKFLTQIIDQVNLVAQGNWGGKIPFTGVTELDELIKNVNQMSIDLQRLFEEQKIKVILEKELQLAQVVQQRFMSNLSFDSAECVIRGYYKPAFQCGGDLIGFHFDSQRHQIYVYNFDVTGHGVASALLTAGIKAVLELGFENDWNLARFYESIDQVLSKLGGQKHMATGILMKWDLSSGLMQGWNASHSDVWFIDPSGVSVWDVPRMPRLGQGLDMEPVIIQEKKIHHSGAFCVASDGLWELESPPGKPIDDRRLRRFFVSHKDRLIALQGDALNELIEFFDLNCHEHYPDDVSLLWVWYNGISPDH